MWHNLSDKHNSRLIIIECVLDGDLHKERLESRVRNMHGIPEVTWSDVENRRNQYLEWKEERLVLDTSESKEDNLGKALKYIKTAEKDK